EGDLADAYRGVRVDRREGDLRRHVVGPRGDHVGHTGTIGVAPDQLQGSLVDVDRPDHGVRAPAGEGDGDRAVPGPEVEQVASPRRRRGDLEELAGPGVE